MRIKQLKIPRLKYQLYFRAIVNIVATGLNQKNAFASNLLLLQNHVKRDPSSYKDEFLQAFHNYESTLQVYLMKPSKPSKALMDSVMFLANVSHCFPDDLKTYPQQLIDILKKYSTVLHPEMRLAFCRALILIRNKNLVEPLPIFEMSFSLFKCQDKQLRSTLYTFLVSDCKRIKTKLKNHKQLASIQQYAFQLLRESNETVSKYAISLMIDLNKKQIWNDAKTVNVISTGCFSKFTKVLRNALHFFLSKNEEKEDSDSENENEKSSTEIQLALRVGKKTTSRKKKAARALKALKKEKKSKKAESYQTDALYMLYDPQDFAEKLFKEVEQTNEGFEIKLMMIELIARLIGIHNLFLLNFYSFLIRFLTPHQREVAKMLWFAAISAHELVPPDSVEAVLMTIANNFITERNTSEVIAVGLNAIREICARCPLAMNEDLLGDLVQYKTYKDKAVSTAAKSLIQLFRVKNPQMLARKDRGKPTEETRELKVMKYGEVEVKSFVPGAEIIAMESSEKEVKKDVKKKADGSAGEDDEEDGDFEEEEEEEEEIEDDEDEDEEEDGDEDGWVDLSHSEDEGDENEDSGGEGESSKPKSDEKDKVQKAIEISTQRILTQEDFKRINREQIRKKVEDKTPGSANKRKNVEISDSEDEDAKKDGLIPYSSITFVNKKRKHDKESRVATVMEGRKDRGKFGHRVKEEKLGKSNKEKMKTKNFMMVRHKINRKHKRSFRDKQIALRNSLLKQKKMK